MCGLVTAEPRNSNERGRDFHRVPKSQVVSLLSLRSQEQIWGKRVTGTGVNHRVKGRRPLPAARPGLTHRGLGFPQAPPAPRCPPARPVCSQLKTRCLPYFGNTHFTLSSPENATLTPLADKRTAFSAPGCDL